MLVSSFDATFSMQLGKFVNHSSKHGNCNVKPIKEGMEVFIGLFATKYISAGTKLRYDYGIRGCDWQKVKLSVFFYSSSFFFNSFIQIYFGILIF